MKNTLPYRSIPCLLWLLIAGIVAGCATQERLYYAAPTRLPGTERFMKTAGFWAAHHPFPDRIILDRQGIIVLNREIQDKLVLTCDITRLASLFPGDTVRGMIDESISYHAERHLYQEDGSLVASRFYAEMSDYTNLSAIPSEIDVRYGLIVRYTNQRIFPTTAALYVTKHDRDFDALQNSALDIGTPVAVMHATLDGQWYYVIDQLNAGWVPAEAVALCTLEELQRFTDAEPFAVVTRAKGALFRDAGMRIYHDYVRMGVRLPLHDVHDGIASILLPLRGKEGTLSKKMGYIRNEDIHEGYLPYTPRTILRQAFELLNTPYGWGGMYGEQDCSRFVQEIFATVGISFPRNSSKQSQVGRLIGEYSDGAENERKRQDLAERGVGGYSLLYLPGHIMLFLGTVDDIPYAIHSTWGYRKPGCLRDRVRVINRVAVTDLSLGEGSKKGSYLDRLRSIRIIEPSNVPEGARGS